MACKKTRFYSIRATPRMVIRVKAKSRRQALSKVFKKIGIKKKTVASVAGMSKKQTKAARIRWLKTELKKAQR